ncbi:MAG: choice-of-anchor C family protein [Crocosphaera sp.]
MLGVPHECEKSYIAFLEKRSPFEQLNDFGEIIVKRTIIKSLLTCILALALIFSVVAPASANQYLRYSSDNRYQVPSRLDLSTLQVRQSRVISTDNANSIQITDDTSSNIRSPKLHCNDSSPAMSYSKRIASGNPDYEFELRYNNSPIDCRAGAYPFYRSYSNGNQNMNIAPMQLVLFKVRDSGNTTPLSYPDFQMCKREGSTSDSDRFCWRGENNGLSRYYPSTPRATITIKPPIQNTSLTKAFSPNKIEKGETATLTLTISENSTNDLQNNTVSFTDTLESGLVIANPANVQNTCTGGTITATPGQATISVVNTVLSNGTPNCSISVDVTAANPGSYVNGASNISGLKGVESSAMTDQTLTVVEPPINDTSLTKAFSPNKIEKGETSTLTLTITENSSNDGQNNKVSFTDTLESGLVIANPANVENTCTGGTITATQGQATISVVDTVLSNGTPNCSISVDVTAANPGSYVNGASNISGLKGVESSDMTDQTLTVVEPLNPDCPQENLIKNGSFELGQNINSSFVANLAPGSTGITDWSVSAGNVDYIGSLWDASEGSRSLDLSGNKAGGVQQTFTTVPGETYQVTFDLAGNPGGGAQKSVTVSAAGDSATFTFDITGKSTSNMGWENKTWTFKATDSATTLTFLSQNDSAKGPALDNVAVISTKPCEPSNPCDPNQPIPGAFSTIRIGDFDGFGFGEGEGLTAAYGGPVNNDGSGLLSVKDFLPDFNGDGKFSNRDGGDPFDNRSDAEVAGTSLTGDGYEDMGSTGSDYTDVFLGKAFGYKDSPTYGNSFPDGDPNTLPNTPGFEFRFKVAKDKLPQGTRLFLNVVLGDFDVEPIQVILKSGNGKTVTKNVIASAKGDKDGMIQNSYVPLDFNQVFSDGDGSGETGYWVGYLDVDFDAPEEPTLAFDFAEIATKEIPLTPCSEGSQPGGVNGNIINIDSTENLSPETAVKLTLPAGNYTLHVIGEKDGGNYDAWTRNERIEGCDNNGEHCSKGWEHKYFYQLGNSDRIKVDRTDRYATAEQALENAPEDITLTLTEETEVVFYVVDDGDVSNNQGGVSLEVISQS